MSLPSDNERQAPDWSEEEEISLKELVEKAKSFLSFMQQHLKLLAGMGLLGGILGFTYAHFTKKITYASKLTFAVEENAQSSLSGLASQFGLDMGGGASLFTSDNLIHLLKSDRILQAALLKPQAELPQGSLYNLYLETHFKENIEEGEISLVDPALERNDFSREQDSLLQQVTLGIQKQIGIAKKDKKASLIEITIKDPSEDFAWRFSQSLIEEAADLYLELKVGKMRRSVQLLQARQDSVQRELKSAMLGYATETDRSQSVLQLAPKVNTARKQLQVTLLTTLYGEITKNLELSKFTMQREEPSIKVIDYPRKPLEMVGRGRVTAAILVGFIFGMATLGFLFLREKLNSMD
jgi:uncharacterized protein involved in exopolysaccharide biosynthesis